jgi:hypothetical protein
MLSRTFLPYITAWWRFLDSGREMSGPVLSLLSSKLIIAVMGQSFAMGEPA